MDIKTLFQRHEAIQKLTDIEKEYEASRSSKLLFVLGDWRKSEFSGENSPVKFRELNVVEKEILRIFGRNLSIEEVKMILEIEPWTKGFNTKTSVLMKRYGFLTDSKVDDIMIRAKQETDDFKTTGVISMSIFDKIINSFKKWNVIVKARDILFGIFKPSMKMDDKCKTTATQKTMNDCNTTEEIPKTADDPFITTNAVPSYTFPMEIPDKLLVDSNLINDIQNKVLKLNTSLNRLSNSNKLTDSFPFFLCLRTGVFMFPPLPVVNDGKQSIDPEIISWYQNLCLEFAKRTSTNAVVFCATAKVACAMTISIFEELFCSLQCRQPSTYVELEYGKKLMQEIFADLYVLEREISEQKLRCVKFLIDVNIFLYYDSPLPRNDSSWSHQQKYIWKLIIKNSEQAIQLLEVLIGRLKEAQTEFVVQYKAFLAFCKLYHAEPIKN